MVVVIAGLAVDEMPAEFELHLFGEGCQEGVLCLRRELGEYQRAGGLPLAPDVFEGTGIEGREGHEFHGNQLPFGIVEVTLGVGVRRHLLAFLQHRASLQARDAELLGNGHNANQTLIHKLIPGCGEGQKLLQHFAVVVGVLNVDCHE